MQIVKQYSVNGDVGGRGVRTRSLEASQRADLSVFKWSVVVCLTGAPRGREAVVGLIRKKKIRWE